MDTATLPTPTHPDLKLCDRCGAKGQVRYVLKSGNDLVFCGHHNREARIGDHASIRRVDHLI